MKIWRGNSVDPNGGQNTEPEVYTLDPVEVYATSLAQTGGSRNPLRPQLNRVNAPEAEPEDNGCKQLLGASIYNQDILSAPGEPEDLSRNTNNEPSHYLYTREEQQEQEYLAGRRRLQQQLFSNMRRNVNITQAQVEQNTKGANEEKQSMSVQNDNPSGDTGNSIGVQSAQMPLPAPIPAPVPYVLPAPPGAGQGIGIDDFWGVQVMTTTSANKRSSRGSLANKLNQKKYEDDNNNLYLIRFGPGPETIESLSVQALMAEQTKVFPHGVSTRLKFSIKSSDLKHRVAPMQSVISVFEVRQTGNDYRHFTVILPKPVTQEIVNKFNSVFRSK